MPRIWARYGAQLPARMASLVKRCQLAAFIPKYCTKRTDSDKEQKFVLLASTFATGLRTPPLDTQFPSKATLDVSEGDFARVIYMYISFPRL